MRFPTDSRDVLAHQHVNIFTGRQRLNVGTYYQKAIRFGHGDGVAGTLPWKRFDASLTGIKLDARGKKMGHAGFFFHGLGEGGFQKRQGTRWSAAEEIDGGNNK